MSYNSSCLKSKEPHERDLILIVMFRDTAKMRARRFVRRGVQLYASIEGTGIGPYRFLADAKDASLNGITNPVQVSVGIGEDAGLTSVKVLGLPSDSK